MPLYEYLCTSCNTHFEKIQKFSDPPITRCEKCGGEVERLLSSPAIQFKGSGWYITDYARKSSTVPSGKAESGAKGESGGSTSSSDGNSSARSEAAAKSSEPAKSNNDK